jgi:predicted transcriptional regulator
MRPRVEWMTQADERILEFLDEKNIVSSPSVIASNIDYTGEYISRRCRRLTDAGLLQRVDPSNYRITDFGEQFLAGKVDAEQLIDGPEDDSNEI